MNPTLRIISPNILSNVERQSQPQNQDQQQIVTSIPATYHVPRGPAAVASISTPRATIATPIVRATPGQAVPLIRPGCVFKFRSRSFKQLRGLQGTLKIQEICRISKLIKRIPWWDYLPGKSFELNVIPNQSEIFRIIPEFLSAPNSFIPIWS